MQRAIACALLADGRSILRNPSWCDDSLSALRLAKALGACAHIGPDFLEVYGSPLFSGAARAGSAPGHVPHAAAAAGGTERERPESGLELDCGESGLCMRMFAPIVALLPFQARLLAGGTLSGRSMKMMEEPLRELGADCRTESGLPPVSIRGSLKGGRLRIQAGESSQFLTGLFLALPLAREDSRVETVNPVSKGYLDMTIETCGAFGVEIQRGPGYSVFDIRGGQRYSPRDFTVEGDWSGAAFLLAAACVAGHGAPLRIESLDPASSQPDRAMLDAVKMAGAIVEEGDMCMTVSGRNLRAFEFDATDCPDLFPPLAALASACEGVSVLRGTSRLKGKESDRAASISACLQALGLESGLEGDTMRIRGGRPSAGDADSFGDHRIAMLAAILALGAQGPVRISDSGCVAKSWPDFFGDLESLMRPF